MGVTPTVPGVDGINSGDAARMHLIVIDGEDIYLAHAAMAAWPMSNIIHIESHICLEDDLLHNDFLLILVRFVNIRFSARGSEWLTKSNRRNIVIVIRSGLL